jgi:threonyl-tRNA synthetase
VLTDRNPESLGVLRHSGAHILATAVRRVRPDAKIGFGPAIEDGFYYDFEVATPFTPEDLAAFEAEMRRVTQEKLPFERREVSRDQARVVFKDDPLKLERLEDLPEDEVISTYKDGDFVDLCRGPHVPDTSWLKHFRLMSTAGAYWRGDSKRQMLQRIYATAFFKKEELEAHVHRIEEAKRRDHRLLGKQLDLFQFFPVAPGAAFWTPRGTTIYNTLVDFVQERQKEAFLEIKTPLLFTKRLWEQSGHWGKYRENMFLVLDNETNEHDMSLKPMNCPSHHLFFASTRHSYRQLPLRYVTFDVLHRNEISGALSGLTRVRQFAQDDCHVYLREDQIVDEVKFLMDFILGHYETFGLTATLKFATRPSSASAATRCGTAPRRRCAARSRRRAAVRAQGGRRRLLRPEDRLRRHRLDRPRVAARHHPARLRAPERFDLTYVGADNAAAPAGGHPPRRERLDGALHRHPHRALRRRLPAVARARAGHGDPDLARVRRVRRRGGARCARPACGCSSTRRGTDDYRVRIREASMMKVPYMLVLGRREAEARTVTVRTRAREKQEAMPLDAFVARVTEEIRSRALVPTADARSPSRRPAERACDRSARVRDVRGGRRRRACPLAVQVRAPFHRRVHDALAPSCSPCAARSRAAL